MQITTSANLGRTPTARVPVSARTGDTSSEQVESNSAGGQSQSAQLQKALNDKIVAELEKTLSKEGSSSLYDLHADDFTPEKVASRILGFIGQALQGLPQGSEEYNERLDQARRGVERGFGDAKEVLESLGAFQGQVKQNAEDTYALLQQGLDDLGQSKVNSEVLSSQSASIQRSVAIEVQTHDGDKVTIQVERGMSASHQHYVKQEGEQTSELDARQLSANLDISYSVSGDLDESELAAIEDLVQQINGVSDTFFEQDAQSALAQAAQIGYNTDELVGYSFKLQETKQARVSEAYRGVEQLGDEKSTQPKLADLIKPLKAFFDEFADAAKNVEASSLFADADKAFFDLFNGIARAGDKHAAQLGDFESQLGMPLEQFSAELLASVKKTVS